jgi:hypothetical protein
MDSFTAIQPFLPFNHTMLSKYVCIQEGFIVFRQYLIFCLLSTHAQSNGVFTGDCTNEPLAQNSVFSFLRYTFFTMACLPGNSNRWSLSFLSFLSHKKNRELLFLPLSFFFCSHTFFSSLSIPYPHTNTHTLTFAFTSTFTLLTSFEQKTLINTPLPPHPFEKLTHHFFLFVPLRK